MKIVFPLLLLVTGTWAQQKSPQPPPPPQHRPSHPPNTQQQQQPELQRPEAQGESALVEDSEYKEEPCNFNFFYACSARQLWEFHKSFRNYMTVQQREPEKQGLFLRALQVEYCRLMDTNSACASRLSEHGCGKSEVDWFRGQTVDFTSDSLGGSAAAWKFDKGQCPWVRE